MEERAQNLPTATPPRPRAESEDENLESGVVVLHPCLIVPHSPCWRPSHLHACTPLATCPQPISMTIDENLSVVAECRAFLHHVLLDFRKAEMPARVTEFHPEKLACEIEEPWIRGSYNLCIPVGFSSGEKWIVRFPRDGEPLAKHIDEKVAGEVAALELLRKRTEIPVPEVKAWGFARDNRLATGAFIMEGFILGESLSEILSDPEDDSVPVRDNLGDVIDTVYRVRSIYIPAYLLVYHLKKSIRFLTFKLLSSFIIHL